MKILFFAPHSAIWIHAFPEALVAQTLTVAGHDVLYVGCGGEYRRYCIPMNARGLTVDSDAAQRESICRRCKDLRQIIVREFGFRALDVYDVLDQRDRASVDTILEQVNRLNYLDLKHHGIAAGKVALYEFLLHHKKLSLEFADDEWREYLVALTNTLRTITAVTRLFEKERFDSIVVYNALYSVNRAACLVAERFGARYMWLHAGGNLSNRLQTLIISEGNTFSFVREMMDSWPKFADRVCPPEVAELVTNHFINLIEGQHFLAYSAAPDGLGTSIRQRYAIPPDAKLLVATMSSYDERLAAEAIGVTGHPTDLLFPRQVDWITALVDHVRGRSDLFLLVRVHPREFPNKRESRKSEHASLLEGVFENLPTNAKINWPADNLSLYDVAEEADVFLNAWSSVGKEMTLLGLPVVIYSRELVLYPPELNFISEDRQGYFEKIDEAIASGWSLDRAKMMYRWYALEFHHSMVNIFDGFSRQEAARPTFLARVVNRLRRMGDPYYKERQDLRQRAPELKEAEKFRKVILEGYASPVKLALAKKENSPPAEEDAEIKRQLRRLGAVIGASPSVGERKGRLSTRLSSIGTEKV
ncbi:MAG: capsule biosynthesis protein [Chthoniobacterales bacterium]